MITITWSITKLDGLTVTMPLDTVITRAYWKVTASSDGMSATKEGNTKLTIVKEQEGILTTPYVNIDTYISYINVTENDVITWVKNNLGSEVAIIENTLSDELQSIINTKKVPTVDVIDMPWLTE